MSHLSRSSRAAAVLVVALAACTPPEPTHLGTGLAPAPISVPRMEATAVSASGPARAAEIPPTPGDDASCRDHLAEILEWGGSSDAVALVLPQGGVAVDDDGRPALDVDLFVPVRSPDHVRAADVRCAVVLGPQHGHVAEVDLLGREQVVSARIVGTRDMANPAYEAARARVRQAEQRAREQQGGAQIRSGDPLLDLVGGLVGLVLEGVTQSRADAEVVAATDALEQTPTRLVERDLAPYDYTRTRLRATRAAVQPVALLDRRLGIVWRAQVPFRESREFHLSEGLHERDHQAEQVLRMAGSRDDAERWAAGSVRMSLRALIEDLVATADIAESGATLDAMLGAGRAERIATIERELDIAREPHLAPGVDDRQGAALLRVRGRGGEGAGFRISEAKAVTSLDAVGAGSVVDVWDAAGRRAAVLVERRDPSRGLALLALPRTGAALALADDGALQPGSRLERLSLGENGGVMRQSGALREKRTAPSLDAGGGMIDVLVGVPAGPPGSPVMRGGRVVGIGIGQGDRDGEIALAVEELRAFLAHSAP